MIEPKRILDARGAPDDMTRLLRAARRDVPPQGLRANTWQSLVTRSAAAGIAIGAAGAVATPTTALAAAVTSGTGATASAHAIISKGVLLFALKSAAVCGGVGVCALATHHVITEHAHARSSTDGTSIAPQPAARHRPLPQQVTDAKPEMTEGAALEPAAKKPAAIMGASTPPHARARTPGEAASASSRNTNPGDKARFEAERVAEIRHMLRGGKGLRALDALAQLDRQPSFNLLGQEREAMRIDAHLLLGRDAEAIRLIRRFREWYPNSPLSARWSSAEPRQSKAPSR